MEEFTPQLTPHEMVERGIFGGAYFSANAGPLEETKVELELFIGLDQNLYKAERYLPRRNKFKTRSGLSFEQWTEYGWFHPDDPYGWFEWYCKYSSGRRHEDDARQIRRWRDISGPTGRWRNRLYSMIQDKGGDVNNFSISPRIRQTLLHWAYEANEKDYKDYLERVASY